MWGVQVFYSIPSTYTVAIKHPGTAPYMPYHLINQSHTHFYFSSLQLGLWESLLIIYLFKLKILTLKSTTPGDLAPKAPWSRVPPALLLRGQVSTPSPSEADPNWLFPLGNKHPDEFGRSSATFSVGGLVFFLNKRQARAAAGSKRASEERGGL